MNQVILHGRLASAPELRATTSGKSVVNFRVAVKREYQKEKADFFPCVGWGTLAENISKYFQLGQEIIVSGRLENREYTDKNGNKRIITEITVMSFDFCGAKKEKGQAEAEPLGTDFQEITSDDDLPF